jgi:hypothetical protein
MIRLGFFLRGVWNELWQASKSAISNGAAIPIMGGRACKALRTRHEPRTYAVDAPKLAINCD